MNAVIYARFSSDRQREESIEGQIRECQEYAKKNGIRVIDTYIDRALSASKETEKRLDFQRMIRDSGKHLFDVVLVWKLDRFARNRYDSAHYKSILKKNGVRGYPLRSISQRDRRALSWNPCWKVWQNIIAPNCLRRYTGARRKTP